MTASPYESQGAARFRKHAVLLSALAAVFRRLPGLAAATLERTRGRSGVAVALRYCALKALAQECGENVFIDENVVIKNVDKLCVGSNVSIHCFCYIECLGGVRIGNDVSIAHASSILSFEHGYDAVDRPIKYNELVLSPVVIDDDCWIGCGARLLAGASIERRVVVAAGAVVKGRLAGGGIYGGVPARRLKDIA
ncbi:MAG TPA: acyltransferase [Phenylobacterium sp.]|nr:acyltransferase [Phenylobacterium sp.]